MTTIAETFVLPSKGKMYAEEFDPHITLRSMTVAEEMRRLSYSDDDYRNMAGIIEACIEGDKPPVHVYDMVLGDYQFLLHKIRVVTYGSNYRMTSQCPNCHGVVRMDVDLDKETVSEFDEEEVDKARNIVLPVSGKKVQLSFQTPRMLDEAKEKARDAKRRAKGGDAMNYDVLYAIMSFIGRYDGRVLDDAEAERVVRAMPMKDANYLVQKGDALNRKVGIDDTVIAKCPECGYEAVTRFRLQSEFFGPVVD